MKRTIFIYYQSDSVSKANYFGGPEFQVFHTFLVFKNPILLLAQFPCTFLKGI